MAFSLTGPVFEEHPHLKGKHKDYVRLWATQGLDGCVEGGQTNPYTKATGHGKSQLTYLIPPSHRYIPITSMENSELFSHSVRSKCMFNVITSNCQNASAPWCIW